MKIIQIPRRFVSHDWGGTETVVLETSRQLIKMGHQIEIVCPNIFAKQNHEHIKNVKVTRVPYFYPYLGLSQESKNLLDKSGGNIFSFALLNHLKKIPDIDILHLHTGKRIGGIGRYIAQKRQIPYVISLHGGVYDVPAQEAASWTSPTKGALEWGKILGMWVGSRRVLDDAAAIICVGKEEQHQVQQRFPEKPVIHLPNGVDVAKFGQGEGKRFREKYKITPEAIVILCVGRITPQKNQVFSVEQLRLLRDNKINAHLVLIGHVNDENYYETLRKKISENNLDSCTTIIPGLSSDSNDLLDAYQASDIFLLPSIHEPFGIVILEAWAAQKPVVASRIGGIPSFVYDTNGILCDVNDTQQFHEALISLAQNKDYRVQLAQAGFAVAQSYSWENITKQLISVYETVIKV